MLRFSSILCAFILVCIISSVHAQRRGGCPGGMCLPAHYSAKTQRTARRSMTSNYSGGMRKINKRGTSWSRSSMQYSKAKHTNINEGITNWKRETKSPHLFAYDPNDARFGKDKPVKRNRVSTRALGKVTSSGTYNKQGSFSANIQKNTLKGTKKPRYKTNIYRQPRIGLREPKTEIGLWDPKVQEWYARSKSPNAKKKKSKRVGTKKLAPPTKD